MRLTPISTASSISRRSRGCAIRIEHPRAYVSANLVAFLEVLEACRHLPRLAPFRLRQLVLGLWRQHQAALRGRGSSLTAAIALRRHQEGGRADGACLFASLSAADDRPALLHRLWPVGTARHGALAVHRGDPRGESRSSSSTTARCGATSPISTTSSTGVLACLDQPPAPTARRRPTGSSTSATTAPRN